jgi:hypothetical protein
MRLREEKDSREEKEGKRHTYMLHAIAMQGEEPSTKACQLIPTSAGCTLLRPSNTGTGGSLWSL